MDDDDSQDEMINRNTSHSKGKRAALWAISDDSDDVEEESEEGESDSGEEDEEGHLDGEDDEAEDEEEDDEEEEEDAKTDSGAFGGTSADFAGMNSDEDTDQCPICLNSFNSQPVATPENCEHFFCLDCILEWAKNANSCPVDRIAFNSIYLRKCYGGKVKKMITVQKPVKEGLEERVDLDLEQTNCEVCGGTDREDRLLLCDGCDAGYHMECLTPPLDSVPVEEWFCPECDANNRNSRDSAEEHSDTESLPSTAHPTSSRSHTRAAGPTRAIARTQQSERVRANVNRHRITQARTSQLAPTYLIQSTWLDDTINAVVAGLNTSVYIRDLAPRVSSSGRCKTRKRRKIKKKKASSAVGKKGKMASKGVKGRRRKVRRTKSRKKLVLKKTATPRSRIANNLGIVKDKKSSSLPTVYRPSEHTLSGMRADIGAASLSIYGDPFDLDPFVDHEEEEQHAHVTSLLEAKRRGISRSALRSHQPVARPVTASLSRRAIAVPQSGGVVEAAPVPDLLGSILSGQSMLLMDSSDVVINRDGSLKATKPMMPSVLKPGCSKSSSSGDASTQINPVMSPNQGDGCLSPHYSRDLPGSSHSSTNSYFSQNSPHLPTLMPSSVSHTQLPPHSDLPSRRHPSLQPPCPVRPTQGTSGVRAPCPSTVDSSSKSKGIAPSLSQSKKAPTKPMWVDVSVLPRIPKIKKDSSGITNDGTNRSSSSSGGSSNSTTSSNGYGMSERGMNSLAGDKGRQQSVDQQKGQAQRPRPDGAGSSSSFSSSFSSSSTASPASQPHYSSASSSSSAVSFRINSSGNSWHSRRLSITSSSASGGNMQEPWRKKEEEARKRQLHRDKQMLLAPRTLVNKEQDSNNIYDPFNPTLSDSSNSDNEAESTSVDGSSQHATCEDKARSLGNKEGLVQSKQDLVHVKTETQEIEISEEEPRRAGAHDTISQEVRCSEEYVKIEKDTETLKRTLLLDTKVKKEPGLEDAGEGERFGDSVKSLKSETAGTPSPVHHILPPLKNERETLQEESGRSVGTPNSAPSNCKNDSSASSSTPTSKKQKAETKSDSKSCSKSPSRDLDHRKKGFQASKERWSSSPETDRGRRGEHHSSRKGSREKEKKTDSERSSRRSRSRERRRARSTSESSQSNSPDRTRQKRRRSQSKDRRRSRSGSSSSSRERSRRKKHKQRGKERHDDKERDCERRHVSKEKRHGRSRSKSRSKSRSRSRSTSRSEDHKQGLSFSKSRSKSRSRSRSRERKKDHIRLQKSSLPSRHKVESRSKDKSRRRSRSSSRERRKKESLSSKNSQKISGTSVPSSKDTKQLQDKKKEKGIARSSVKEEKVATINKQEAPSSIATSKVKKEVQDVRIDNQATTAEIAEQTKTGQEIKTERQPLLDMFEDSPINKPIKKEETDHADLMAVKAIDEFGDKADAVKPEICEIPIIKSEPSSPHPRHVPSVTSFSTVTTPVTADSLQESSVSQSHPVLLDEQPNTAGLAVPVKQEVQQPSDSDDDFNVDVMLDNLDYVKSERTEGSAVSVKQEKEVEEGKNEGGPVPTVQGTKSKSQVKRVTWNIQEPEGPQPEKSASKLALYKLRLKQEGARRPSSTGQTQSQDLTGTVSDSSKKGAVIPHSSSSRSDGVHPEGLSATGQGEAEEGDLSKKDKYLKKLHMQERAIEEVKLAIKPFYQRRDINKEEYKEILRKAVQKVCHSKSGEINPVKVGNLVKAYVDKYKHARKHKKGEDSGRAQEVHTEAVRTSDSP
uniref:PHD and RING finger domain-containing protein 1 n=1 Tax=Scatophagus argus TaxID=75038 RepID=UPI001ED845CC|nr:PHD and RING finger domain-containing protein 1 [Scatophagus argus]XP_046250868.1 PHD and RING finger domain-containing protein 1 [Scatophagus argus]XP_046250869.1 PHD and RING finger domain-containing protein 1 [Scatophagus argus]XP_046250870.1 PHD and RING finger domain-containing protein 1 [Scatophagus argus]XP_046250871.1 PHD and RING finger domain-containing protein 1 [Scatophagus argus]XP_046250872.1 PHD and RING finger domain-containing protein 1 [Scatophagus argus]